MVFWSLDRFSREGIRKTILYLQRLDALGVRFKSYTEAYLDTDNELVADWRQQLFFSATPLHLV